MVLHVNQAEIVVIKNWFYASERVFFSPQICSENLQVDCWNS